MAFGSLSYNVVVDPYLGRNLSYWDGTGTPNFGPVPAGEVLRIELSSGTVTLDGSATALSGHTIESSLAKFNFHHHWVQRLWGSESNDPGDMPTEGFYLFSVNAQVSSFGTLVSDPLYIIMAHGFEKYAGGLGSGDDLAPEMLAARNWVQNNLVVPEPSALVLCVGGVLLLPALRLRNRNLRRNDRVERRGRE